LTCDLFIRSYWKDLGWLQLCLAAIERYCGGFRSVIVVVPRSTGPWLRRLPALAAAARVELCCDYRDDYLGQQATKLMADTWTEADFICHLDSDCIFCRPTTPEDLIVAGRPRIFMSPCSRLGRHWPWRRPTEDFLGWPVSHSFMQRPPFTFPRWIYGELRAHAAAVHGVDLERYVTCQPPRGFSEFNVLGAFAHARHRDDFVWIEDGGADADPPPCRWYWSWGGLDGGTRREIEALLDLGGERDGASA